MWVIVSVPGSEPLCMIRADGAVLIREIDAAETEVRYTDGGKVTVPVQFRDVLGALNGEA